MPTYRLLEAKGHAYGLNQKTRSSELAPGEASVATNVDFDRDSVAKAKGGRLVCQGDVDGVFRGAPPGASLYLQGDQWWLEHPEVDAVKFDFSGLLSTPTQNNFFRSPFHARHGVILIPEGAAEQPLALDPSSSLEWAMETMLWSDDVHFQPRDPLNTAEPYQYITVLSKGWSAWSGQQNQQWRVVIKPVDSSATTGVLAFYVALEITDATTGTVYSFEYDPGSGPASFFYPGERVWVAWSFDPDAGANGEITSYYRRDGASTVSSTQSVASALASNGNIGTGNDGCPIMVGGQFAHVAAGRNFNGVVGELRFYDEAVGNAALHPTWDGSYEFYDSEFPDSELDTGGLKDTTDLSLYWSFALSRVVSDRFILPRYSTGTASNNGGWLTGQDAAWVTTLSGVLGPSALAFMPSGPNFAEQRACFYRGLVWQSLQSGAGHETNGMAGDVGPELSATGIRVPSGNLYLQDKGSGSTRGLEWRDGFSVAVAFTTYDVDTDHITRKLLFQINYVVQGPTNDEHAYKVLPLFDLGYRVSGGNWVLEGRFRDAASNLVVATGTTTLAANTAYTGILTLSFDGSNYSAHLYLNGDEEVRVTAAQTKPASSVNTGSVAAGDNSNDEDGRELCYPMMIGAGCTLNYTPNRNDRFFMFGAEATVGAVNTPVGSFSARRWWAFHRDFTTLGDVKKTPNDGVAYRGFMAHRGTIGWVGVWGKKLSESEAARLSSQIPTDQDIRGYGQDLLSMWLFDEGGGTTAYDKGSLGNHLRFQPDSQVRAVAGPFGRVDRGALLQLTEQRSRTLREGVSRRELYALGEGCILRLVEDSSGEKTWEPISSHQFTDATRLGSTFRYSDFVYWCPGVGPVLRVSRNRVTSAGIAAPFSQLQNDFRGWQEGDRDGTFQIIEGGAGSVFSADGTWIYAVTYYDPESGTESPPSRLCAWTATTDLDSLTLFPLPRSHDRHVRRYRLYRTARNSGQLLFLAEVNVQAYYVDSTPDEQLGQPIDSEQNFPPPQDASIGVQWGPRAIYAGSPASPATAYVSKEGFPESCPLEYALTLTAGRSSEITAVHVMQGRAVVFLQDSIFQISDAGGDIGPDALTTSPLQIKQISDHTGCVGHHTLQWIDQVGLVFAGERGLYVTGDGVSSLYVGERVEPFWESLDKTSWRLWHSVHWRRRHQYVLFCSDGAVAGRNNLALVWDYKRNAFSIRTGIQARHSQVVEDEDTGVDRFYVCDYLGQLWELDTDDDNLGSTGATSGTVQSGATATVIPLVAGGTLPTAGSGLRGVELLVNGERVRVASNDANSVTLEEPLAAVPATNDPWKLGSIASEYRMGKLDYGVPTILKQTPWIELAFEAVDGSAVDVAVSLDGRAEQEFVAVDAGRDHVRAGPIRGRHREIELVLRDDSPDNRWELKDAQFAHHMRGRAGW